MNETDFTHVQILLRERGFAVSAARYDPQAFGSWHVDVVATPPLRIVWDGRDCWQIVQDETSEVFNGLSVWRDIWIGKTRSEQTPERAVEVLSAHSGAA